MNIEDYIGSGTIDFFNLYLDPELPLEEQTLELDESLLNLRYQLGYSVDLGWAPWQDIENGSFILTILFNNDWDNPLLEMRFRCIDHIPKMLSFASQFVESLIELARPVPGDKC